MITDEFEPIEEGLDPVQSSRFIPSIEVLLSLDELDKTHKGYQPPIADANVDEEVSAAIIKGVETRKPRKGKGKSSKGKGGKSSSKGKKGSKKGKGRG